MGHASIARAEGAPLRSLSPASREIVGQTAAFALCWAFLNAVLNVRYPAAEPRFWYLLPSVDVTALFCLYALAGAGRLRIPALVQVAVTGCFLFFRVLRFGDGIEEQ